LCESVDLRITLRSFQTLSEADAEQERRYSRQSLALHNHLAFSVSY